MQKLRSGSLKKALQASHNQSARAPRCQGWTLTGLMIIILLGCSAPLSAQLYKLDRSVLQELSEDRKPEPTEFWQFVSNSTNYTSFGVPAALLVGGLVTDNPQMKRNALHITESILVSSAMTFATKYAIHRSRPSATNPDIISASNAGSPSMPSGHTSEAFATATSLSMAYPKWYVIVPAYAWAGSVGYSRMYLGVHYPSDVAAGALLGITSAYLTRKANIWLQHRHERRALMVP